jgi:hypothetical protein
VCVCDFGVCVCVCVCAFIHTHIYLVTNEAHEPSSHFFDFNLRDGGEEVLPHEHGQVHSIQRTCF